MLRRLGFGLLGAIGLPVVFFFQNCGPSFESMEIASLQDVKCKDVDCTEMEIAALPVNCIFNGQKVADGSGIIAYLESSATTCTSEIRTCSKGELSGSYLYPSCSVSSKRSCLFDGKAIPHDGSVKAYKNSSVPNDSTCEEEMRVCNDGELSGSFQYAACSKSAPKSCLFDGKTVPHNGMIKAYLTSSVPLGQVCQSQNRICVDGTLSGNYNFGSCVVNAPASCTFNGQTIPHNGSVTAYLFSSVSHGKACTSQSRKCTNGSLSGSYTFGSCTIAKPKSCSFNGQTVLHGNSVTAFEKSSVPFTDSCRSETRNCNNGTLLGSFAYGSCVKDQPKSCLFNGQTIPHNSTTTAYQASSVPFGQTCKSQSRKCTNGSLSGSYTFGTCSVAAAASCTFNGQSVPHGQSRIAYLASSVPFGQTCQSQSRTCTNGSLSGSYTHATCSVASAKSCTFNGQAVAHGSSITAYRDLSVPSGQTCQSQSRTCSNGVLSGTFAHNSCQVLEPAGPPPAGSCSVGLDQFANPRVILKDGETRKFYRNPKVLAGGTCKSRSLTCKKGVLHSEKPNEPGGVLAVIYQHTTCTVGTEPGDCVVNGYVVPNNGSFHFTGVSVREDYFHPGRLTCVWSFHACTNGQARLVSTRLAPNLNWLNTWVKNISQCLSP